MENSSHCTRGTFQIKDFSGNYDLCIKEYFLQANLKGPANSEIRFYFLYLRTNTSNRCMIY